MHGFCNSYSGLLAARTCFYQFIAISILLCIFLEEGMAKTEKKPGEKSNERRSRGVATEGTPSPVPDTHR